MKLAQWINWKPPTTERVEIHIHPDARSALIQLLWLDDYASVGFSEFIMRAVHQAALESSCERNALLLRQWGREHGTYEVQEAVNDESDS
jgi:hypothetical protein